MFAQDQLVQLGFHDFVCVLCLRLDDSTPSSIFQSNGRETGVLSFSLVYFIEVPFWHTSIPSSTSVTVQPDPGWEGISAGTFPVLNPQRISPPDACRDVYLLHGYSSRECPNMLEEWKGFIQLFNITMDIGSNTSSSPSTLPHSLSVLILTTLHSRILMQFCFLAAWQKMSLSFNPILSHYI